MRLHSEVGQGDYTARIYREDTQGGYTGRLHREANRKVI